MTQHRLGRRDVLVGLGAAAIGGTVGVSAVRRAATTATEAPLPEPERATPQAPAPLASPTDDVRALFGALGEGGPLSTHWRIESVHAVRAGAIPVVMSTIYGQRFAVEIFRADPGGPAPIARAGGLALHLVNRGDGSSRTNELAGLGVMALGRALDEQIAAGAQAPAGLETHRDRTARDPRGSFHIPV